MFFYINVLKLFYSRIQQQHGQSYVNRPLGPYKIMLIICENKVQTHIMPCWQERRRIELKGVRTFKRISAFFASVLGSMLTSDFNKLEFSSGFLILENEWVFIEYIISVSSGSNTKPEKSKDDVLRSIVF